MHVKLRQYELSGASDHEHAEFYSVTAIILLRGSADNVWCVQHSHTRRGLCAYVSLYLLSLVY
jgi:hypothetical protein